MDRKTMTIILAAVLIGCFFMPFFKYGSASGFDFVFGAGSGNDWEKYIWLLIPLSGALLLIGALNKENYFLGRGLLSWLPLLTVIYIVARYYSTARIPIADLIKVFGTGFWITLVVSLILAFYNPKRK